MKINLGLVNNKKNDFEYLALDIQTVQSLENGIATEIECNNLFYSIPFHMAKDVVNVICSKLRVGGKLTVIDKDAMEVVKLYLRQDIDSAGLSKALYGSGSASAYNMQDMQKYFKMPGLRVTKKKIIGTDYLLEFVKC